MKLLFISLMFAMSTASFAESNPPKSDAKYYNLEALIERYSKASGQSFLVDISVRGGVTILIDQNATIEESFDQLSSALAVNGFAIVKHGNQMVIKSARNAQRDLLEVTTTLPALKPERMVVWIYKFKHVPATRVMREIRILPSKDGEMNLNESNNQIIFTDFVSNLHRINEVLKLVDVPVDAATAKLTAQGRKETANTPASSGAQK